MHTNVLTGQ